MHSSEDQLKKVVVYKQRFLVLDIFRGIFASFVFLFHLSPFSATPLINNSFVYNSDLFVDFFFVLSGFVISINYSKMESTNQIVNFLKRRVLRIYPLHLFILMIFVVIEYFKASLSVYFQVNNLNNPDNNIYTLISSFFLMNSTPLFNSQDVSWNIPSWSISAEMIAYILFGFMVLVSTKVKLYGINLFFPILILIVSIMLMINFTGSYALIFSYNFGFLRGIIGFYTGIICFKVFNSTQLLIGKIGNSLFHILELLIVILIYVSIYLGELLKPYGLIYELLFFICIFVFSFEKGMISNFLKNKSILQNIGKYSYSIYMSHALLISIFNVLFIRILKFSQSSYSYLFFINFLLIYLFSAWTYKHIEMKFYRPAPKSRVKLHHIDPLIK